MLKLSSIKCGTKPKEFNKLWKSIPGAREVLAGEKGGKTMPRLRLKKRGVIDEKYENDWANPWHARKKRDSPDDMVKGLMYNPEGLDAGTIGPHVFRTVQFGLDEPDLMARYADRITEVCSGMKPRSLGLTMVAFGRAGVVHEKMLARLSDVIPGRLRFFGPLELSMLCSGLMKLRYYNEKLLRRIADEVPHRLPVLEPSHISQIVYAFSSLGYRDQMLYVDIADDVMRRIEDFNDPIELLQVVKALAKAEVIKPGLWECLTEAATRQWEELIRGEIPSVAVQYLSAVASIDDHLISHGLPSANTQDFASAMCTVLLEKGSQLDTSLTARGIASLGKLHRYNEAVWSPLMDNIMNNIDQLRPDHIGQVSLGVARAGRAHPLATPLLAGLSARAIGVIDDFDAWCVANTMQGFAALGKRDVKLFSAFAKHLAKNEKLLEDATPQGLAGILHSMAKVKIKSDIFLYIMANVIISKMSAFEGQALGMVLYAYGRLNCNNEALVRACIRQLSIIIDEINLISIHMIENGLKGLGALTSEVEDMLVKRRDEIYEDDDNKQSCGTIEFDDDTEDLFDIVDQEEDPLSGVITTEVTKEESMEETIEDPEATACPASEQASTVSDIRAYLDRSDDRNDDIKAESGSVGRKGRRALRKGTAR